MKISEPGWRSLRAQWIRELDKRHQQQREACHGAFPADERLAHVGSVPDRRTYAKLTM